MDADEGVWDELGVQCLVLELEMLDNRSLPASIGCWQELCRLVSMTSATVLPMANPAELADKPNEMMAVLMQNAFKGKKCKVR